MGLSNFEDMETAVKNRAHERVQERLKSFKKAILAACGTLLHDNVYRYDHQPGAFDEPEIKEVFTILSSGDPRSRWPRSLWKKEEAGVRAALMNIMNEAQKALLAQEPKDTDCHPVSTPRSGDEKGR